MRYTSPRTVWPIAAFAVAYAALVVNTAAYGRPLVRPLTAGTAQSAAARQTGSIVDPASKPKCINKGDITAAPCPVDLTASNPTQTITITGATGTLTERDTCSGIAIVTMTGSNTWQVTPGASMGTCRAWFYDTVTNGHHHRRVGKDTVPIANSI